MAMTTTEIEKNLRALRLHGMCATLQARALQTQQGESSFMEGIGALVQDEMDYRFSQLIDRRFNASGLKEKKLMNGFDWSFNPRLPKKEILELISTTFVQNGEDALLIGHPGTGKSHRAKAVVHSATQAGYPVVYREAHSFFADIFEAIQTGKTKKILKLFGETDLLVIDDLFLRKRVPDLSLIHI